MMGLAVLGAASTITAQTSSSTIPSAEEVVARFLTGNYKEFNAIQVPTRIARLSEAKTNDVFTIQTVTFIEVPDAKFALPIHLPEWPAKWNQIDELYPPPSFAKNLPWPWKGEHARWFHEGFSGTNDAFFWSYVVLNTLEGDTLKTDGEVQDALHRYDGSLYGKAFPPEKIKVAIGAKTMEKKRDHAVTRRSVTIDGFDAESTKKELRTHLQVFRWYCPTADRTAFLILRSPRPFQANDEVWQTLFSFRDRMICHAMNTDSNSQ